MLLERGRVLLEAADKLTTDAEALSRGWETHLTIVTEALVPTQDFFPLIEKLATKSNTQLSVLTEVLAGAWERLEQGRADIVVAPDMHFRSSSEINSRKLYSVLNVYVAAPDHPIHQEPEPLSEVTRVKYRGVAVADTARERPVLTVQLLDKQPRLTVSTIEDKRQALLAGLGVATMPYPLVEKDIAEGRLRVVSPEYTNEIDIIMAWRRDSMGEAKSWCLREIPKLFAGK
jgi:DNA-binding transcriptional LysR family regulator